MAQASPQSSQAALEIRDLAKCFERPAVDGLTLGVRAGEFYTLLGPKGTRQKVALAGALVHEPRLIILDEPFTGLDAASARLVKNVLRERVGEGCSVVMTTHILEVAERMADRIGVMCDGRLVAEGTLEDLRRQAGAGHATLEDTFLALVDPERARGPIAA